MRSVIDHRYTAWQACHGPGKSFSAAQLMAWWMAAHPVGEPIAVSTAPRGQQMGGIVWREFARALESESAREGHHGSRPGMGDRR